MKLRHHCSWKQSVFVSSNIPIKLFSSLRADSMDPVVLCTSFRTQTDEEQPSLALTAMCFKPLSRVVCRVFYLGILYTSRSGTVQLCLCLPSPWQSEDRAGEDTWIMSADVLRPSSWMKTLECITESSKAGVSIQKGKPGFIHHDNQYDSGIISSIKELISWDRFLMDLTDCWIYYSRA